MDTQQTLTPQQMAFYVEELQALNEYMQTRNLDGADMCSIYALALGFILKEGLQPREVAFALDQFITVIRNAAGVGKPDAH